MFRQAAELIRDSDMKPWVYVVATGGGSKIGSYLWEVPGISSVLAGESFTYSCHETDRFLQFKPDKYCSEETAIHMAMAAYMRACESVPSGRMPIGLAVTANVASSKEHRGDHRIHAAIITPHSRIYTHVILNKGCGHDIRGRDGRICDQVGFNLMLRVLGCSDIPIMVSGSDSVEMQWEHYQIIPQYVDIPETKLRELFFQHPLFTELGRFLDNVYDYSDVVLFPGTFNPIHDGHMFMAEAVQDIGNVSTLYMITADSPHKPPLPVVTMLAKAVKIRMSDPTRCVLFTQNDPLFIDKARKFPGASFLVGADSVERLLDPRWYGGKPEAVVDMLDEFERLGTRFYVFGRDSGKGMVRMSDIPVIGHHKNMFVQMPDNKYAISSTQIREGK